MFASVSYDGNFRKFDDVFNLESFFSYLLNDRLSFVYSSSDWILCQQLYLSVSLSIYLSVVIYILDLFFQFV